MSSFLFILYPVPWQCFHSICLSAYLFLLFAYLLCQYPCSVFSFQLLYSSTVCCLYFLALYIFLHLFLACTPIFLISWIIFTLIILSSFSGSLSISLCVNCSYGVLFCSFCLETYFSAILLCLTSMIAISFFTD